VSSTATFPVKCLPVHDRVPELAIRDEADTVGEGKPFWSLKTKPNWTKYMRR